MKTLIIKHVELADLPAAWQAQFPLERHARVTVRIEEEEIAEQRETSPVATNPLFGIWKDRKDIADVDAHVNRMRAARYSVK